MKNLTYFLSFRNLLFLTLVKFALVTKKLVVSLFSGTIFLVCSSLKNVALISCHSLTNVLTSDHLSLRGS